MALKEIYTVVKRLIATIDDDAILFQDLYWWRNDTEIGETVFNTPSVYIEFLPIDEANIITLHDGSQILTTRFKLHLISQFYEHVDSEMQYLEYIQAIHNKLHFHICTTSEIDTNIIAGSIEDVPFSTPLTRFSLVPDHSASIAGVMLTSMEYECDVTVDVNDSTNVYQKINLSGQNVSLKTNIDYVS